MYYTIYKVTNKINGKFYIGSHKTRNLDDGYMGSGKYLNHAIQKYGVEYFTKEILFVFETSEEMYAKETEIVNKDFLATENTYNLKVGGFGGFDYINDNPEKYLTEKRLSALMTNEERTKRWMVKYNTDVQFRACVLNNLEKARITSHANNPEGTFKGRSHSEDTKQVMSSKAKERLQDPTANSQYGTMWINNGIECKKIKKDEPIPDGWNRGRKIKF